MYRRGQKVKNDIILPYAGRIASIFEEMWSIYDNQVKAYENMDDEYESITKANYWKHTDYWDRASDDLERLCIGVKDFVVGFVQGAVDVVVGLMDVVIGLACLLTAGVTWGVYKQYDLDPPDWASDRLEGAGNTATALLEDPLLIVEGISQGATDAVEQKGICYCAGYLTGSIIADKGLSEGLIALRSQNAVSRTGMISTTGKFSAEGMSHVDDVTRAGVRSLDNMDDLARAGAKTLDSVEDVVTPTLKTLDKVEDAATPVVKTLDKVEDAATPVIKTLDKVEDAATPVVKTLDKVEDATKPVVKTLDKLEDASEPVVKTLDKVEDVSKPLVKVDDIPNPEINSLDDLGKKAVDGVDSLDDLGNAGKKKPLSESGINSVDDIALRHSSVGDFTYNPKTGQVSRMKGGGHGQSNINFLEENGIEYNIVREYDNGVRVGNVPKHKTPSKRAGTGQAWFPKNWSDSKINEAGNFIANLSENKNLPDGVIGYGEYDGVRVGIIKTDGKVGTIFPDADLQP